VWGGVGECIEKGECVGRGGCIWGRRAELGGRRGCMWNQGVSFIQCIAIFLGIRIFLNFYSTYLLRFLSYNQ
jgi:hypothetical protein